MRLFLGVLCTLSCASLHGSTIIRANDPDSPFSFVTPITIKAYDRESGIFFVGSSVDTANNISNGAYALARACRPDLTTTTYFTPMAQQDLFNDKTIEFLAISHSRNPSSIVVTAVAQASSTFAATTVGALSLDASIAVESNDLNDASGSSGTAGIIGIAAAPDHVFALVRPSSGNFGEADSGIALIEVDRDTQGTLTSLIIKDATTGINGNQAFPLNDMSSVLTGDAMQMEMVTFASGQENNNQVSIFYDEEFDRFYLGVRIATAGTTGTAYAKAVVVGRLDDPNGNSIALQEIVANSAIDSATNQIAVGQESMMAPRHITVRSTRVLHASTGPSYLIVNGNHGIPNDTGNVVFALPLVNNPTNSLIHGTLADKNSALVDGVFVTPATAPGQLATSTEDAAQVGSGALPMEASDTISDIDVVGDTVFVSISKTPSTTNNSGVFYSQALFDADGKVIRWTPWRRATPYNAFPGVTLPNGGKHDGAVLFFSIDAVTGSAWIIEADSNQVVGYNAWNETSTPESLLTRLNSVLRRESMSVLSLDQYTRGFEDQNPSRGYGYALFGGTGVVAFALTKKPATLVNVSQVPLDYTDPANFSYTGFPGCPQVLEYSRRTAAQGDENYFFTASDLGFFAFAQPGGTGFNTNTLTTLNTAPFTTGSWQEITSIPGTIIDIKTSGRKLYILTLELTQDPQRPIKNTVYSVAFAPTLSAMFAPGNITTLAQTGAGAFADVSQFMSMRIIATGDPTTSAAATKEQLVLATNQGLFISHADQTAGMQGIIDATNQTTANWQILADTQDTFFFGIGAPDTPVMHTVWPFTVSDRKQCNTFEQAVLEQLSGGGNSTGTTALIGPFNPETFNARKPGKQFLTFNPMIYFWSDGARRFFILSNPAIPSQVNMLGVLPFDTLEWNAMSVRTVTDPGVGLRNRFFWVRSLGDTGMIMAGTNKGVIALT